MKESNKLNTALKDALQGHEAPLHEAQWLKLRMEMGGQKSKKRFLPWLMLFCLVALTSLGVGYWLGNSSNGEQVAVESQSKKALDANSGTQDENNHNKENINDKEDRTIEENKKVAEQGNNGETSRGDATKENDVPGEKANKGKYADQGNGYKDGSEGNKNAGGIIDTDDDKDQGRKISEETLADAGEKKPGDKSMVKQDADAQVASELEFKLPPIPLQEMKTMPISDSLPKVVEVEEVVKVRGKDPKPGMDRARFALSFSTGLSPLNFKVRSIENSEKVHHDSRQVFEQGNDNSKSYFGHLGFDWYIRKNIPLSINTGIQYRNIVQEVNQSYTLLEIPFRDNNGNILAYIPDTIQIRDTAGNVKSIPDPTALKLQNSGTNRMTFISIPIRMGYMWPLGSKSELQVSAGLNLSMMTGARGSIIAINEQRTKTLRESYKKGLNLGLTGGLQFNTHLYKSWWIGLEVQWQQNSFNYNDRYGVIRSKININNYNLLLKYKF